MDKYYTLIYPSGERACGNHNRALFNKIVSIIGIMAILYAMSVPVYAGSIPEDLLHEDGAKVFIGTVESYTTKEAAPYTEIDTVTVIPAEKIKGDVKTGAAETYSGCHGFSELNTGTEYLFGYFDENNFYIYEIKSRDDRFIRLTDSENYNMTKRLEDYINKGAFAAAEKKRLHLGTEMPLTVYMGASYDSAEKVSFRINNIDYDIDKDKFFQTADNIIVKDIKDTILKHAGRDDWNKNMLYISVAQKSIGENTEQIIFANISEFGEISDYTSASSSMPDVDYEMKPEDLPELYLLLPEDVQKALPVSASVSDDTAADTSSISEQANKRRIIAGILPILVISFIVWYILYRKKNKNKEN